MTSDDTGERRLHPAATVIDALRHARAAGFAMLAVIASQGIERGLLIVVGLLMLGALLAFVQWRTTRYAVVDDALHLRTGILSRKEQVIPRSRISALDTTRGVLQRVFGVVAVQVQTAGGGKTAEVALRAVSFGEAERLRHALGHRATDGSRVPAGAGVDGAVAVGGDDDAAAEAPAGPTFTSPSAVPDDAPVVYAITPRELLVTALTSPSIAVVAAAGAAFVSFAEDLLPDRTADRLASDVESTLDGLTVAAAAGLAVFVLLVATLISVAGTVLLYGGFRVTRDDRRLRVRRGILTERVGTVPLDRIHGVRVIEAPLRQALGYASIEAEVAGYAGQDEVTRTLVPLVRRSELPAVLARIVPGNVWPEEPLEVVPTRARRRYLTAPLLVAVPLSIAFVVAPIGAFRGLAVLPVLVAVLYGRLAARDAGWHLGGGTLTMRWRALSRTTVLATAPRLQRMEQTTSPFQRRADLATLGVRLSSARGAQVKHLDEQVVHGLLGRAGR